MSIRTWPRLRTASARSAEAEAVIFSSSLIFAVIEYAARSARVTEEPSASFTTSLLLSCCATELSVFSISFSRFLVSASSGSVEGSSSRGEVDR